MIASVSGDIEKLLGDSTIMNLIEYLTAVY